jgi:hypothetical protein
MPSRAWNPGWYTPGLRPSTTNRGVRPSPIRSPAYGSGKPSRVTRPAPRPRYESNQRGSGSVNGSPPSSHSATCSSQNRATRTRADTITKRYDDPGSPNDLGRSRHTHLAAERARAPGPAVTLRTSGMGRGGRALLPKVRGQDTSITRKHERAMVLLLGGVLLFDDGGMLRQHHSMRLPGVAVCTSLGGGCI